MLNGSIRPADRVEVAAAGPPALAAARTAAISSALLRWGIVATAVNPRRRAGQSRGRNVGRYAVTLPACPNWSQSLQWEFTNAFSSNYGCDDATNLGLMVASPADLVGGRPFAGIDALPAINAIDRYLTDKITPPPQPTASPFAAPSGGATAGAGAAAGPGAAPTAGP